MVTVVQCFMNIFRQRHSEGRFDFRRWLWTRCTRPLYLRCRAV